ncbi:hypothetical protein EJB05_44281 [Eragrostis curvula]|uniref:Uncharacterized protein n=1 Tax=Eragrostis curvula TaxID=38414 RepID=A0A5J9THE6_9POAL|nr:hypothetical protein EJB05_44281 [Eragrostis curvula]
MVPCRFSISPSIWNTTTSRVAPMGFLHWTAGKGKAAGHHHLQVSVSIFSQLCFLSSEVQTCTYF